MPDYIYGNLTENIVILILAVLKRNEVTAKITQNYFALSLQYLNSQALTLKSNPCM